MTGAAPQDFKPFQMTFSVSSDGEAQELDAAWREIVSGKRTRVNAAAQELHEIMERAMMGLEKIVDAIEANPGTTQTRRLVQFLAGLYNGNEYHVDLTDLRALDTELANACVDYLNYDRLAKVEVHSHLPGGGRQINQWIRDNGVRRRWRMSAWDNHALRLDALADRLDKRWDALVDEALGEFLTHQEAVAFECMRAADPPVDGDYPLVHARVLASAVQVPLCGSSDGPWTPAPFRFKSVSCPDCKHAMVSSDE